MAVNPYGFDCHFFCYIHVAWQVTSKLPAN